MLFLTRNKGESIVIADSIELIIGECGKTAVEIMVITSPEIQSCLIIDGEDRPKKKITRAGMPKGYYSYLLSKNTDERLRIGSNIFVVLSSIRGRQVSLGVSAPKDVAVHRREIYEAFKREGLTVVSLAR